VRVSSTTHFGLALHLQKPSVYAGFEGPFLAKKANFRASRWGWRAKILKL